MICRLICGEPCAVASPLLITSPRVFGSMYCRPFATWKEYLWRAVLVDAVHATSPNGAAVLSAASENMPSIAGIAAAVRSGQPLPPHRMTQPRRQRRLA